MEDQKLECVLLNGFSVSASEKLYRWKNPTSGSDVVMKPQWFHSAGAILMLHKYPSIAPETSFRSRLHLNELYFIKIAREILMSDEDGIAFLKYLDTPSDREIIIIDDANHKVTHVSEKNS